MGEVLSLCHLSSPCESLEGQAKFEKLVIEVRVRSFS